MDAFSIGNVIQPFSIIIPVSCRLHAFSRSKPTVVEGRIGAAVAAGGAVQIFTGATDAAS